MYYKSVNRGLTFTKPGIYAVLFVMAIGMLAIVSGVNGLYIFLSAGLSALIVSGMLSERTIRNFELAHLECPMIEAASRQAVKIAVTNRNLRLPLYGVDLFILEKAPKFRIMTREPKALVKAVIRKVSAKGHEVVHATTQEPRRGFYNGVVLYFRTEYPFGLLEKYKISRSTHSLTVVPPLDPSLFEEMCTRLAKLMRHANAQQEFFSHRTYMTRDSLKFVDWRRSANKGMKDWVVKRYKAPNETKTIIVDLDTTLLQRQSTRDSYEMLLSRTYTCLKAARDTGGQFGVRVGLRLAEGVIIWGFEGGGECLAKIAPFGSKALGLPEGERLEVDAFLTIRIDLADVEIIAPKAAS